jgi:excisionase family DNA binding protein
MPRIAPNPDPLISIVAAAERTGYGRRTIERLVASGDLPAVRIRGRQRGIRVRTSDVDALLEPVPAPGRPS